MTQFCYSCEKNLPVSEFPKHKNRKQGIDTQCKPCQYENHGKRAMLKYFNGRGRLAHRLRGRIFAGLKGRKIKSSELLGCSWEEYRKYLESKWQSGMTWKNWGKGPNTWQIDHIVPLASNSNDLSLYHYLNTQPLWYYDHIQKSIRERREPLR